LSLNTIPHNWTAKGRALARANVLLVSLPKSGRTWLRFMIRHYLCALAGVPFSIDPSPQETRHLPRLACSHDLWEHLTAPRWLDRISGKYLIPPRQRRRGKILLAVRDLRDVMVSLHLQLEHRGFRSGAAYEGSLSEMIRDPRFGAARSVDILEHWLDEWQHSGRCHIWHYEAARQDPRKSLREVLRFMGSTRVDEGLLAESVEFADFDNMQAMEREGHFDRKLLQPGDSRESESFKVRRGEVGGFVDYLSDADALLIEQVSEPLRNRTEIGLPSTG